MDVVDEEPDDDRRGAELVRRLGPTRAEDLQLVPVHRRRLEEVVNFAFELQAEHVERERAHLRVAIGRDADPANGSYDHASSLSGIV